MPTVLEDLRSVQFLCSLPNAELVASAPLWVQHEIDPGGILWEAGESADGLALLVTGEISVEIDGTPVGTAWAGEVLGEASAILHEHARTATLRAAAASRVLVMPDSGLHALRAAGTGLYDALLTLAEHALVRRIHEADLLVARLAPGTARAPAREHRSALVRIWNALRPGLPGTPCPPVEPLLWLQPGLCRSSKTTVAAIARGFRADAVAAGTVLFLEGEPALSAWLIAEGEVDVWRNVRGGRAQRLATLGPGRLLGVNALIEHSPRAASCVAASPCWLYRMDGVAGYQHLDDAQLRAWKESLLGTLTAQVRTADHLLGTSLRTRVAADVYLAEVLRASGFVAGATGSMSWPAPLIAENARRSFEVHVGQQPTVL